MSNQKDISAEKNTQKSNQAIPVQGTPEAKALLEELRAYDTRSYQWQSIGAMLSWDMETEMPRAATAERSDLFALLSEQELKELHNPKVAEMFQRLGCTDKNYEGTVATTQLDKALVRSHYRDYRNTMKLPEELVIEISKHLILSQQAWVEAREKKDFSIFEPFLAKSVDLFRKKAEYLGYKEHIYDALLDEYEEGLTCTEVSRVFTEMKHYLVDLLGRLRGVDQGGNDILYKEYSRDEQDTFGREVAKDLGFDFSRGVMKESVHPFTNSLGPNDIRFTTRYSEPSVESALFSTIHETGHALYEQGFGDVVAGTSLIGGASLSVHESQSRFWENIIGRSKPFWDHYYPRFQELFPEQTKGVGVEEFHRAINQVQPSMIRVNADEVTYGLHIILRFEIEKALIGGEIEVAELPGVWNKKMEELLGVIPEDDSQGVLQDVHWSFGLFGYFPTYAMGNLYGAQFYEKMQEDITNVQALVKQGNFAPILGWLRTNIHQHGSLYRGGELLERVTGKPLSVEPFKKYLESKYGELFIR